MTSARTLPNFLIIGAMKCGTSTLHEQLARQPGIFMSEPKEPNYFSNDEVFAQGVDWYRGLFAQAAGCTLRGESSTHYTKLPTYPQTLARMRALLPALKLIYVMRHPVDRLVSHYIHECSMQVINAPLDEALDTNPELVQYGCYRMQIEPFLNAYGRESVLPVFLERMQVAPQDELERVCRFLGYPHQPMWVDAVARQNVSAERLRVGSLGRWLLQNPVLKALRRTLVPRSLRSALKARLTMNERPQLSESSSARLAKVFDRDLATLGRELGVDLSCASFNACVSARPLEWAAAPGGANVDHERQTSVAR